MSNKKDNAVAPVVGSSSIVEPGFVAIVALDVTPFLEVEPRADLHMYRVSQSPSCPPPKSTPVHPSSPFYLES